MKTKFLSLTVIFLVVLGIAGGVTLLLMKSRINQSVILQANQNESVLLHLDRMRVDGFMMVENVSKFVMIGGQDGSFSMGGLFEADELLAQFNDNYAQLELEIRGLVEENEQLFCDAFLTTIDEEAEQLMQAGLRVFDAVEEDDVVLAWEEFIAAESEFLETIDVAFAKQSEFDHVRMDTALSQFGLLFWGYWISWLLISGCALVTMNRLCKGISTRINAMTRMVEDAGAGQFTVRLLDEEEDELGELARKMNDTATYLAKSRQDLERTTRELSVQLEERRVAEVRLAEAATHDSLTGLPNRASFFGQFDHAIALADRKQENIALLFIDMDGLKIVNDAFGHDGGDMLIQQVGDRLLMSIRKSDYVARLAGDEFVVILENLQSIEEDVTQVCTKLLKVLAEPYDIRGRRIKLTASIGVSLFPGHGESAEELLQKADLAMYKVKNGGKNNFAVYVAKAGK